MMQRYLYNSMTPYINDILESIFKLKSVFFFGEGARMSKQCLQDQYAGGIPFITSRQSLLLQVTRTYKHLGTVASADMSMQPEITSKMTAMKNTVKAVKGDFLARPSIPLEPRLLVLKTLVFSKGLFQAGTWPLLYVSELSRMHKQMMSIYASIVDAGMHVQPPILMTYFCRSMVSFRLLFY